MSTIYEFDQALHDKEMLEDGRIEDHEEGRTEGLLLAKRDALYMFLSRYGEVPQSLMEYMESIDSLEHMDTLLRKAFELQSIEKFNEYLNAEDR